MKLAKKKYYYISIDTQSALIPITFLACRKTSFDFSLLSKLNDQLNKYQLQVTFPTLPLPSPPSPGIAGICFLAAWVKLLPLSLGALRGPGRERLGEGSLVLVL